MQSWSVGKKGHKLAGMICSLERGVITVVGGHQQEVLRAKEGEKVSNKAIRFLQGTCVALGVTAVAVEHVEINQVGEAEAGSRAAGNFQNGRDGVTAIFDMERLGYAAASEDVVEFTDGDDRDASRMQAIEDGGFGEGEGEVAAVFGAAEGAGGPEVGACDDAADAEGIA